MAVVLAIITLLLLYRIRPYWRSLFRKIYSILVRAGFFIFLLLYLRQATY